jgi:Fe-S-cluster containining protein
VPELASQVHGLADDLIRAYESENLLPHPVACREGCSFCCFNQVEVTPPEALSIGHFVGQNFSGAGKDAMRARVSRALNLKSGKSRKKLARLRGEFPCPLLRGGRCAVYEVRPLVCRAMHAFAAGACQEELHRGRLGPGEYYAHRYEFVWSISAGLQNGCREMGCQTGVLDLDYALEDIFAADGPLDRWLRGERLFRKVFGK